MPVVHVHMLSGRTADQKRELVRAITQALVEHAGAKAENVNIGFLEYDREDWGKGGLLVADAN